VTKNPAEKDYMMVMRYAEDGSLRKLLDKRYETLTWKQKIFILYFIARGLNQIHKAGLVHKDFHSGNIVNKSVISFITDFGLCRPVSEDSTKTGQRNLYGVLPYVAPELLKGKEYIQASDIYSFGIIMTEVLTGHPPYHNIPHDNNLGLRICLGLRPEIECEVPNLLLDIISKCLDKEPKNRPTALNLRYVLRKCLYNLKYKNDVSKFYNQVKLIESSAKPTQLNYTTHSEAVYTSRLINTQEISSAVSQFIDPDKFLDVSITRIHFY
jgi:serine/threonine protein kinase